MPESEVFMSRSGTELVISNPDRNWFLKAEGLTQMATWASELANAKGGRDSVRVADSELGFLESDGALDDDASSAARAAFAANKSRKKNGDFSDTVYFKVSAGAREFVLEPFAAIAF